MIKLTCACELKDTFVTSQDYLLEVSNDPIKSKICKQRVLCRTVAGNLVYVLTITSPSQHPNDVKVCKSATVPPGTAFKSLIP